MRISAKFPGRCAECGGPIPKGADIEYVNKKAYHLDCAPGERPANLVESAEAIDLADRLGFRQ